jgi:peptidyl-prolyl cis-trans isomerase B (cyclophilin B)
MKKVLETMILAILAPAVMSFAVFAQDNDNSTPAAKQPEKTNQRPVEPPKDPEPWDKADVKTMAEQCVTFETAKGVILFELYPESAPETVRNFLNLVSTGALDSTTFSRVVPDFVIQGGNLYTSENLTNALKWRAVRTIPDEPNLIKHERGVLSMARPDEPNSATTDFFILLREAESLDGKFAAFGRVIRGFDVVVEINKMPVDNEAPKEPVKIIKATAAPCRDASPESQVKPGS